MDSNKVWLIILDGRGLAEDTSRSAIAQAHTPNFDRLWEQYPHTTLVTYGEQVGLPEWQMGNSEVWHMNIGAWRVVYQDLVKIGKSMREWDFEHNEILQAAIAQAKSESKPIYLVWLVSDGWVHSHIDHLEYLIDVCHKHGVSTVVHAITDGRDVGPQTGIGFITRLHEFCQTRDSHIQSIIGRYYAMDRDNRWERVAKAYDLMVKGQGQVVSNPIEGLQASYDAGVYDEFVEPIIIWKSEDLLDNYQKTLMNVVWDYVSFLNTIEANVADKQIDVCDMTIDHISYRTQTDDLYIIKKQELTQVASMIHESMISDRLISIWKLQNPIKHGQSIISIIELSAPKSGKVTQTGLDHVEYVTLSSLDELQNRHPHIIRETKWLARIWNQDIECGFDDGTRVKFHNQSLEQVVISEWGINLIEENLIQNWSIVIVTNFRTDRGRELVAALNQSDHDEQGMIALDLTMITMTNYDDSFHDVQVLAPRNNLTMTLGEVLSLAGKTQLRIAETEKYPHVTFFFSWGQETEFAGEHRIVVPSPKVATYDLQPEMSAPAVTQSAITYIQEHQPDFIALNWANTDMVWHTGMISAAMVAAEAVDAGLWQLVDATLPLWYTWIIIADHGNADIIINPDGSPHTAHTLNPVPCIITSQERMNIDLPGGKLADIAPTILTLMWVDQPSEMDGVSLI